MTDLDERLAAWLDGAMAPADARAFEAELAADPALAARAATWRGNDKFLADAFAPIASQPIDPAMLQALGLAPQAANDNPVWWRRYALPMGGAIAASLAAIALFGQGPSAPAQDAVSFALDTSPSRASTRLADGRVIEPLQTSRAADGRWCREYRLADTRALACRERTGWKVEAQEHSGPQAGPDEIVLAGGGDSAALDAAYQRLKASDPLDPQAEAGVIAAKWNRR